MAKTQSLSSQAQGFLSKFVFYPLAEISQGRKIRRKSDFLSQYDSLSDEKKLHHRKLQLHKILVHANKNVPYYQDLFSKEGFNPDKILNSLDYLSDLPFLDKDILRQQGDRMLAKSTREASKFLRKTNGSTGIVTDMWYDQDSLDWTAAAGLFTSTSIGRTLEKRKVVLCSEASYNPDSNWINKESLKGLALNRKLVHTKNFSNEGLSKLLTCLQEAGAHTVQGNTSSLYYLALYCQQQNIAAKGLFKIFECTGETLSTQKAKVIEEVFGCHAVNIYGNAEFGIMAFSRNSVESLHVIEPIVHLESSSLGNGMEELIATGLTNFCMPLIRYKTGDIGKVFRQGNTTVLEGLKGRVHDLVPLQGNMVSTTFIQDTIDKIGGVDEWQIVLPPTYDKKLIRIVPNQNFNEALFKERFYSYFGHELEVQIVRFEDLKLSGWRDKFRYVVNN